MAKKRAKVDATLAATRSSGIFTQDMEDISPGKGKSAPQKRNGEPNRATISDAQIKRLWAIGYNASPPKSKAEVREIIGKHGFASADKITKDKYDLVCGEIEGQGGSPVDAGG